MSDTRLLSEGLKLSSQQLAGLSLNENRLEVMLRILTPSLIEIRKLSRVHPGIREPKIPFIWEEEEMGNWKLKN